MNFRRTLFACYRGYITGAIVNNIAPLLFIVFQREYSISFEMLGRLVLFNFGTQVIVDYLAMRVVDRIGYRIPAVAAHAFCILGLVGLGVLPRVLPNPYLGLVLSVVLYAIGSGLIEVIISPIVDSLPGEQKASAMSLLHSFYCWGYMIVVILTTLALQVIGEKNWYLLPLAWALVPVYNFFSFMRVPLQDTIGEAERTPLRKLFSEKAFLVALLLMLAAGASELSMAQWSSLFAELALGVPKVVGDLLGPTLFALLMGVGRLLYGIFGHRIKIERALWYSGILCVACYLVTVFFKNPVLSLAGCAVCGFSVSLMWPGTLSLSSARFPKGGAAMFGLLAIFGDIGASVGPWAAGIASDAARGMQGLLSLGSRVGLTPEQTGLKFGLFVSIVFPLLMTAGILLLRRMKASHTTKQNEV